MISEETRKSNQKYLEQNIERLDSFLGENPHPKILPKTGREKDWEEGDTVIHNELAVLNHSATKKKLVDAQEALKRIHSGNYGTCLGCGQEINEDRLLAVPEASRCKSCQERFGLRIR